MEVSYEMSFRVNLTPVPQPRQRTAVIAGQTRNYTPKSHPVTEFKEVVRQTAERYFRGDVTSEGGLLEGPLHVGITIVLPRPKSLCRKKDPKGRIPCHKKKGDNDNFEKAVWDAMTGIVYKDDCQIYSNFTQKFFAATDENPHTLVLVQEHEPEKEGAPTDGRERKGKQDLEAGSS